MADSTKDKNGKSGEAKTNVHAGHRERLRQKVSDDPELAHMLDHEVLELCLSYVIPRKDVNPIAHELIDMFGSLDSVLHANPQELLRCKSVTQNAAFMLSTLYPVVRRAMRTVNVDRRNKYIFNSPEDCIEYIHKFFIGRREENACALFFDINYRLLRTHFKKGFAAEVSLDPSELASMAVREGASYVLVAHNHPTGDVTPSFEDVDLAQKLYQALYAVNVRMVDHIVFADYDYFSFYNNHMMDAFIKEMDEKTDRSLAEDTEVRHRFLADLNEYILDADNSSEESFATVLRPLTRESGKFFAKNPDKKTE